MNKLKIFYALAASLMLASCSSEVDSPITPESTLATESTLAPDEEYLNIEFTNEGNEELRYSGHDYRRDFGKTIQPTFRYAKTSLNDVYYHIHSSENFKLPEVITRPADYGQDLMGKQALAYIRITYLDSLIHEGDHTLSFNENGRAYGLIKFKLKKKLLEYIRLGKPRDDLKKMFDNMVEVVELRELMKPFQQRQAEMLALEKELIEKAKAFPSYEGLFQDWLNYVSEPAWEDNSPEAELFRQIESARQKASEARRSLHPLETELLRLEDDLVYANITGIKIKVFVYANGELDASGKYRYKVPYQPWAYLSGGKSIGTAPKIPYYGESLIENGKARFGSPADPNKNYVYASMWVAPYGAISKTYICNLSNETVDVRSVSIPNLSFDGELLIDKIRGTTEFPDANNTGGIIPLNITIPAFSHAIIHHWFPAVKRISSSLSSTGRDKIIFTLSNGKTIASEDQNYFTAENQEMIYANHAFDYHSDLRLWHKTRRERFQGQELNTGMLYIIGKNPYLKSQEGVNRIIFPFGNSTAYPPADGTVSYFAH